MKADYEQIDQLVTREQILAAKGHELSLLVARHIMHDHITIVSIHNDTGCQDIESCKDYAIDMSITWTIIEKLKERQILIDIFTEYSVYRAVAYYEYLVVAKHVSESVEEAICKAALLAVLEVNS